MITRFAIAALSLFAVTGAHAQDGFYAGGLISRITYSEDGFSDASPTAIGLKVGTAINKNFAVEARLGTGLSDDSISVLGTSVDIKVDNFFGVYAKGILPLSDVVSVYGLAGYTRGELTVEALGQSSSDSDSDFSYGLGADFALSKTASLGVEWARLFKGSDYKVNSLSLSVSFKF